MWASRPEATSTTRSDDTHAMGCLSVDLGLHGEARFTHTSVALVSLLGRFGAIDREHAVRIHDVARVQRSLDAAHEVDMSLTVLFDDVRHLTDTNSVLTRHGPTELDGTPDQRVLQLHHLQPNMHVPVYQHQQHFPTQGNLSQPLWRRADRVLRDAPSPSL